MCFRTLLKGKDIKVNGKKVCADMILKKGDEVCYYMSQAQESKKAFEIVYEDANVIVVDKLSGVNSEAVFSEIASCGEAYFIHRLDRNTEGLMIFARTERAEAELLSAFRDRRIEKTYYALVIGQMPSAHAVARAYLKKDEKNARVFVSALKTQGEEIVTEYEVVEERGETSLLKITLHTGKTHQIRAHLAFLGHPVVGDGKYGDGEFNRKEHATRQRLLAKQLRFQLQGNFSYLNDKQFVSKKFL